MRDNATKTSLKIIICFAFAIFDYYISLFADFIHSTLILEIISRIPVNAIDRIITVFIPYGLSMLINKIMKDDQRNL